MRHPQVRYQLFVPKPLSDRFEAMVREGGATKSALLAAALEDWLDRKGANDIQIWFGGRLDRINRQLSRLDRNDRIAIESLAVLARYILTNLIPVAESDTVAMAYGRDRFDRLVQRVAEALATGRQSIAGGPIDRDPAEQSGD
ncbi:hypothetical protein SAMN06295912_1296 [Sphingomonas laterariae]|uniref:Ribbon-helix-helix protein, copG family n=1 Tax=Edaphosphingomonas laterariae TaxID=861865 RepID=A0A239IZD7_9SPHN|nr:CopG family transcriptional regulator [Sphingomonas laterariae]SNS99146.1 hypothetical protein SAMN06295912_1296 [Sphingomonas laterariae]